MTAQELPSVATFRAEFNLITNNSSLMISLSLCVCQYHHVFLFSLYSVCLWKYTYNSHTSIYLPINGLSEKKSCLFLKRGQIGSRKEVDRKSVEQRQSDRGGEIKAKLWVHTRGNWVSLW